MKIKLGGIFFSAARFSRQKKISFSSLDKDFRRAYEQILMGVSKPGSQELQQTAIRNYTFSSPIGTSNINTDFAPAWYQRGLLYLDWEKPEAAISDFSAAVKADAQHLDAYLRIAAIHHQNECYEEASINWKAALNIDPEHEVAKSRLKESQQFMNAV